MSGLGNLYMDERKSILIDVLTRLVYGSILCLYQE